MLRVNYQASLIVVNKFTPAEPVNAYGKLNGGVLVARDRAPDAPGLVLVASGAEKRLFDLFSPAYHTVLVFTSDALTATGILEALQKYPRNVIKSLTILSQGSKVTTEDVDIAVDHDGHTYHAYLATDGKQKVVVVRPDGVAGAIVLGPQGVEAYFDKILIRAWSFTLTDLPR